MKLVKMRSLGWAQVQSVCCPYKKRNLETDLHTGRTPREHEGWDRGLSVPGPAGHWGETDLKQRGPSVCVPSASWEPTKEHRAQGRAEEGH